MAELLTQYYVAGSLIRNDSTFWKGAQVFDSPSGTPPWTELPSAVNQPARGVVGVPPPNPSSYWRIHRASMEVDLHFGIDQIESVPLLTLLNGANIMAVVRSNGQVALMQFQDAEVVSVYTVRLSNLLRGRRGSEIMDRDIAVGDRVVFLDQVTLYQHKQPLDVANDERTYRAVTRGQSFEAAKDTPSVVTPRSLMPYAPVHARYDGDTLTWVRRTRIGGESDLSDLANTADVPLAEASELYEIDIIDDSGETVVRTVSDLTAAEYDYAIDEVRADGIVGDTLTVVIYQISDAVGRGFPGRFEIDISGY